MNADKSKLKTRAVKGFPLTHSELDGNFTELSKLIDDVDAGDQAFVQLAQLNQEQYVEVAQDIIDLQNDVDTKQPKLADVYNQNVAGNANKVWGLSADGLTYEWKTAQLNPELPATPIGLGVPRRNAANNALEWVRVGQEVGDVLVTARTSVAPSYVLPNTIYSRAAYPELFAVVGTQNAYNDGTNFALQALVTFIPVAMAVGKDGVIMTVGNLGSAGTLSGTSAVAQRSVDGGVNWTSVSLTGGMGLVSIATDGNGVWIAMSYSATCFRSTDNGVTWSTSIAMPGVGAETAQTFAVVTDRNGIWLGVHCGSGGLATLGRSTDNGLTWASRACPGNITGVSVNVVTGDFWVKQATTNIFKSSDNGLTFKQVLGIAGGQLQTPMINDAGVIVFGESLANQLYISTDNGITFKTVANMGSQNALIDSLGVIIASYNANYTKSYDYGETWVAMQPQAVSLNPAPYFNNASVHNPTDGSWLLLSGGTNLHRASRLFNYDVATQFKTPAHKAPKGYKAFIKAKVDIV